MPVAGVSLHTAGAGMICRTIWSEHAVWLVSVAQGCVMPVAGVSLRTAGAGMICRSIGSEHAVWLVSVAQVCV